MSLIDRKVNNWSQAVSSLDDKPKLTAAALKAAFDSNTNQLKPVINGIIDDLTGTDGASNIGLNAIDGLAGNNVLETLLTVAQKFSDRYTKVETDSEITTQTKDLVQSITFDENTGIFTITKKDGSQVKIDTALEKIPAKFELIYQDSIVLLRITNIDGSTTQTDVTALMSGYSFNQSDSIAFSLSGEGSSKTVTATIRQAGVTKDMLASDVIQALQAFESKASEYAYYAEQSANNAQTQALYAQNAAQDAIESQQAAENSENNAAQSAEDAAGFALSAQQYSGNPPIIENGNWYTWDADNQIYTDTGLPAKGEKGEQGIQGEKGDTGKDFVILGFYNTLEQLQQSQQQPNAGDAYGVGANAPYNIYIWDSANLVWVDNGIIQGAKGDTGEQGIQGEKGEKGDTGLPATINGVNAITITTQDGIYGQMVDDRFVLSAKISADDGNSLAFGTDNGLFVIPSGGGSGKRVCRFTIGTSTNGWTTNDCDFLCDGTDDHIEIQAAIDALPENGGEIMFLDGEYILKSSVTINKPNIIIKGNGSSSIINYDVGERNSEYAFYLNADKLIIENIKIILTYQTSIAYLTFKLISVLEEENKIVIFRYCDFYNIIPSIANLHVFWCTFACDESVVTLPIGHIHTFGCTFNVKISVSSDGIIDNCTINNGVVADSCTIKNCTISSDNAYESVVECEGTNTIITDNIISIKSDYQTGISVGFLNCMVFGNIITNNLSKISAKSIKIVEDTSKNIVASNIVFTDVIDIGTESIIQNNVIIPQA